MNRAAGSSTAIATLLAAVALSACGTSADGRQASAAAEASTVPRRGTTAGSPAPSSAPTRARTKQLNRSGRETDEQQLVGEHAKRSSQAWARLGGLRTAIYSNSLVIVMTAIWLASWLAQSLAGRVGYNAEQLDHQAPPVSWATYITTSDFWNRTLQNWQSEFLAVGSMVILSVYLRPRLPGIQARRIAARRDGGGRLRP